MAWDSLNLASALSGVTAAIHVEKAALVDASYELTDKVAALDDEARNASDALLETSSYLQRLNESGLYTIALTPKAVGWQTRMASAHIKGTQKHVPNLPWSCGMCTITLEPNLEKAKTNLESMFSALTAPIGKASVIMGKPSVIIDPSHRI